MIVSPSSSTSVIFSWVILQVQTIIPTAGWPSTSVIDDVFHGLADAVHGVTDNRCQRVL